MNRDEIVKELFEIMQDSNGLSDLEARLHHSKTLKEVLKNQDLIDTLKITASDAVTDAKDKTGTILILEQTQKKYGKCRMLAESIGYDTPQQAIEELIRMSESQKYGYHTE